MMQQKQISHYPADFLYAIHNSEVVGIFKLRSFLVHRLADCPLPKKSVSPSFTERKKKQPLSTLSFWKEQKYYSYSWTGNSSDLLMMQQKDKKMRKAE